jgi:predicted ATPase
MSAIENRRLLVVTTYRPSELAQARHPFVSLKLDLMAHNLCREIAPGFLDETAIDRYVRLQFPDHTFPAELSALIHRRTEGNPLFVADLLRDLRRRQIIKQENGQWILTAPLPAVEAELPPSVRSLIQRKMEALDEEDRRLLGAAGVQGIDFDTAIVARALGQDQSRVEDRLERLEREHAVVRFVDEWEHPDRTLTLRYRFVHHVYHNAFYDALRVTRRAALSRSVADALIATADKTERHDKDARERTTQIALLLETARDNLRAAEYFNLAAQSAARLYANEETERLALRGLALLEPEPPSEARVCAELDLQMTYGLSVKTSRGYAVPEVGRAYARARTLCREIHNPRAPSLS